MAITNQSSSIPNFEKWMEAHPDFVAKHIVRENENWGKLICEWTEQKTVTDETGKAHVKKITHIFVATINLKTGEVYMDCRRRKIFAKHAASLIIGRPLITAIKTLYHVSMFRVIKMIFFATVGKQVEDTAGNVKREKITWRKAGTKIARNFADIVRTPIYSVALLIINLATVILIPLSPNIAYDLRALHGKIEKSLNWGKIHTSWTLGRCFQSGYKVDESDDSKFLFWKLGSPRKDTNYEEIESKYSKKLEKLQKLKEELESKKTEFQAQGKTKRLARLQDKLANLDNTIEKLKFEKLTEMRMSNFARSMIKDRRDSYNPFYQLIGKLDPNVQYTSANYSRIGKEEKERVLKNLKFYVEKVNSRFKGIEPTKTEDMELLKNLVAHIKADLELLSSDMATEKTEDIGKTAFFTQHKQLIADAKTIAAA